MTPEHRVFTATATTEDKQRNVLSDWCLFDPQNQPSYSKRTSIDFCGEHDTKLHVHPRNQVLLFFPLHGIALVMGKPSLVASEPGVF